MIRFFAKTLFELPVAKEYDYLLRLDSNIYFQKTIPCDIFLEMAEARALFGFVSWKSTEPKKCMGPIKELTRKYGQENRIEGGFLESLIVSNFF
jgi:hypothetical protein